VESLINEINETRKDSGVSKTILTDYRKPAAKRQSDSEVDAQSKKTKNYVDNTTITQSEMDITEDSDEVFHSLTARYQEPLTKSE
jgi:hypothetical protein